MTRLVVVVPDQLPMEHPFVNAMKGAGIAPERQTFASATSPGELEEILTAEDAEFALLAGLQPLHLVREDLTTQNACGRPFFWKSWKVLATIHPEALARNASWSESVGYHLGVLRSWGKAPNAGVDLGPFTCVSCLETATDFDLHLLPWCAAHLPEVAQ